MPIIGIMASSTRQGLVTSAYDSLVSYTVPSDTGSVITFNDISQSYKDLIVIIRAGATYGGSGGASAGKLYVNNDTTAKYTLASLRGNGNGTSGGVTSSGTGSVNQFDFGASWAGNPNAWISQIFIFQNYTSTSRLKNMRAISGGYFGNGTNSDTTQVTGTYNSTSAITSLQLQHPAGYSDGDLRAGTQIQLFGIKG